MLTSHENKFKPGDTWKNILNTGKKLKIISELYIQWKWPPKAKAKWTLADKLKVGGFVTNGTALGEYLKEVFQAEG